MSLYTDASIITTPNGFKAGKLYSLKPTDGSGDLDVVRNTTATRVNSAGLIETVGVNVPRLDYSNGSCPSILVEPQRTNLLTYSEQFDNVSWVKGSITITSNNTNAPNGLNTAGKLIASAVNDQHRLDQITTSSTGINTFSIFAKKAELDNIWLRIGGIGAFFNLTTGVVLIQSGVTANIESFSNGWYRCSITLNSTIALETVRINLINDLGQDVYLGDGTSGIFIWGAQLEEGSNATSYIPTVASTVTRNADVISKTGISSLIGQTEGTIFIDIVFPQSIIASYISVGNRIDKRLTIGVESGIFAIYGVYSSGSLPLSINTRYKIALSYNNTNMLVYINGVLNRTLTTSTTNDFNSFVFDEGFGIGQRLIANLNSAIIFKTRLTNTELTSLTTL